MSIVEKQKHAQLLKFRMQLPLEEKIKLTVDRLASWSCYDQFRNHSGGYIAYSGGLGSRVLVDIYLRHKGEICSMPIVFVDTGLEYPSVRAMGLKYATIVLKPKMSFKQVIEKYGYPVVSKAQSLAIYKLRHHNLTEAYRNKLLYGDEKGTAGKLSDKWKFLLDAPFEIHSVCCDIMKKRPVYEFEKKTQCHSVTAEMAEESSNRRNLYLKHGCQMWDLEHPKCTPMAFWTQQDLYEYVLKYDIDYAEEYGDIVCPTGKCHTTGESRTGCMFCPIGIQFEPPYNNRFTRMAKNHPMLYDYCIHTLGIGEVLDYMGINYKPKEE